jgi:23S rRNA (uracil1939-C5)-methyltransferase
MSEKNNTKPTADGGDLPALELTVEKLLNGGDGLARHEGQAIFVPLTVVGDRVQARITKRHKNFSQAQLEEVLDAGPGRRSAPCPYFGDCGGCNFQHLEDEAQRRAKATIVEDCFTRLARMDVSSWLAGPEPVGGSLGYRNRIRVFASPMGPYGLMRKGTHNVVPFDQCPVMAEPFNSEILPWLRMLPPMEQIVVRMDDQGGWLLSCFGSPNRLKVMRKMVGALAEGEAPAPGCRGLLFNNRPIWGHDYLVHQVAGHKFRVSAQSFFQANLAVTESAVATVRAWLAELQDEDRPGGLLADLFCGVGLFSLSLAGMFDQVVAIDSDESACRDAMNNVSRDADARDKVTVLTGDLGAVLRDRDPATAEQWRDGVCVVDPPRTGLGKPGVKTLVERSPRHVVMMSCDPATLARDAAQLVEAGYQPQKMQVLDMFPQTSHIETLMLLSRQD